MIDKHVLSQQGLVLAMREKHVVLLDRSLTLVIVGLAVLACVWNAKVLLLAAWPGRGLEATPSVLDFGVVDQFTVLQARFVVVNHSRVPITLMKMTSGCGCAELRVDKWELPPGESATISAKWDINSARGEASNYISVSYVMQDAEQQIVLETKADVVPDMGYTPERLHFVRNTIPQSQQIAFLPRFPKEMRIVKVSCTHKAFTARLQGERQARVTFRPLEWANEANGQLYLIVETTNPRERIVYVPIRVV